MKKYLLWSFERGSRAYDVICIVILAFIFITPPGTFHDRPDVVPTNRAQTVCHTNDDDARPDCIVKVKTEQDAVDRVKASFVEPVKISRTEPVYDAAGQLVEYWVWIQR